MTIFLLALLGMASSWTTVHDKDGITIKIQAVDEYRTETLHAEKILDGSLDEVFRALQANKGAGDSVVRETVVIYSKYDHLVITQVDLPWPIQDRYFATRNVTKFDDGTITIVSRSVQPPKRFAITDKLLGAVNISRFVLTEEGPQHTKVEMEFNIDPKGLIPAWIMNQIQRTKPLDFYASLEKTLIDVQRHEDGPKILPAREKP